MLKYIKIIETKWVIIVSSLLLLLIHLKSFWIVIWFILILLEINLFLFTNPIIKFNDLTEILTIFSTTKLLLYPYIIRIIPHITNLITKAFRDGKLEPLLVSLIYFLFIWLEYIIIFSKNPTIILEVLKELF